MTICSLFSNQKSFCWKYQQDHKPWPKLVSSKREFHRTGNKKTRALLTWAADFTVSNAVFRTQFLFVCCPYALPHPHPGGWAELMPPLSVGLVAASAAHSPGHCHWFIYRSRGEYLTQSRWKVMNLLLGFLGRVLGFSLGCEVEMIKSEAAPRRKPETGKIWKKKHSQREGSEDLCMCVCSVAKSCPTLCDPMDCSPPGSSVHGIFQARILEWVAMPSSRGFSPPRDQTSISCIAGGFFTTESPGSEVKAWGLPKAKKGLWAEKKLELASGTRGSKLQVWLQMVAEYQQMDGDHKPLGR